ncbi:MAG: hypothetical protein ACR2JO_04090 [Mycobacteriales bacterium]
MTVRRALRGFMWFWIDFIVGDDWVVAVVVGVALLATWALVHAGFPAWWLLPIAVVTVTAVSLRRTVLRESGHP